MIRVVTTIVILSILVVSGIVQGNFTGRWIPKDTDLTSELSRVTDIHESFGDWRMVREIEPDESVLRILLCAAYLQREYQDIKTGDLVSVVWIAGPSGPTVAHIPEICYSSQNHSPLGERESHEIDSANSLWKIEFQSRGVGGDEFAVFYGWSRGGPWIASDYPRIAFGGEQLVYKMQLSSTNRDAAAQFAEDFVMLEWRPAQTHRTTQE